MAARTGSGLCLADRDSSALKDRGHPAPGTGSRAYRCHQSQLPWEHTEATQGFYSNTGLYGKGQKHIK